jgi:two-component system, NarL family, sensor histidine kinase UhpB
MREMFEDPQMRFYTQRNKMAGNSLYIKKAVNHVWAEVRILLVEDNPSDAELIEHELVTGNFSYTTRLAETEDAFIDELMNFTPQVILADFSLPQFSALRALELLNELHLSTPLILVTGSQSEEAAVECLKRGAEDYILKESLKRLPSAILHVLDKKESERKKKEVEHQLFVSNRQLRALSARLQSIREEERTRIAREIHDELGQTLTGLRLDIAYLEGKLKLYGEIDKKVLESQFQSMISLVDASIQNVQKIATELRPQVLDDLGLIPALEWQTAEFQSRTKIQCSLDSNVEDVSIDADRSTALFRILQESLTNVARHSNAKKVHVKLQVTGKSLHLTVSDDGKGISEVNIPSLKSLGLLGMRERAHMLGGILTIKGQPGHGTVVSVELPL